MKLLWTSAVLENLGNVLENDKSGNPALAQQVPTFQASQNTKFIILNAVDY